MGHANQQRSICLKRLTRKEMPSKKRKDVVSLVRLRKFVGIVASVEMDGAIAMQERVRIVKAHGRRQLGDRDASRRALPQKQAILRLPETERASPDEDHQVRIVAEIRISWPKILTRSSHQHPARS